MSEKEIIEILKGYSAKNKECLSCAVPNREACELNGSDCIDEAIQGLLDLYNKEKEENNLMKAEFNRLEDLEDNTEQLKGLLGEKIEKIIDNIYNKYEEADEILDDLKELEELLEEENNE